MRILDGLSDDQTEAFRIPTALPMIYELNSDMKPLRSHRLIGDAVNWWRNLGSRYKPRWLYWG